MVGSSDDRPNKHKNHIITNSSMNIAKTETVMDRNGNCESYTMISMYPMEGLHSLISFQNWFVHDLGPD